MENAAKALIIAGGILLAIMTLTLLVYGLTASARLEQATAENKKNEEITNFNLEYQAFNKKRMYGIDLITLINKAIDHNNRMNASAPGTPYYIDIIFTTKEHFKNEIYLSVYNETTRKTEYERYGVDFSKTEETKWITWSEIKNADLSQKDIEGNKKYELLSFNGKQAIINIDFKNIFENGFKEDIIKTKKEEEVGQIKTITCKLYSALTNFKRAIFECKSVKYDPQTGRIYEMTFEQVKSNEEIYKPK